MREFAQLMPYRYTGKFTDYSTGLVQMDSRWYNGHNGRFIQPDNWNLRNTHLPKAVQHELMQFTGVNTQQLLNDPSQQMAYGYVRGNPLKYVDPYGLYLDPFGRGSTSSAYSIDQQGMKNLSIGFTAVSIVSASVGAVPITSFTAFGAVVTGYAAAAMDDEPKSALAVEAFTHVTGTKLVGTATKIYKGMRGVAEESIEHTVLDAGKNMLSSGVSNGLKSEINDSQTNEECTK